MAFAQEKFATVAQNYISRGVASNFYKKAPFLAILGALTLGNQTKSDSLKIGRPDSGEILSGGKISPAVRLRLGSVNEYLPRVQKFKTNNSAYRTGEGRVALPDVLNKTTESHGQANQNAASFHWNHLDTPILIWHEDKIRAGQESSKEGQGIAMSQVIDEASEIGMQDHIDKIATDVWTGNPVSQTTALWSSPLGIIEALKTNNTYAKVDRTVETLWQAQVDATLTAVDIKKIIDDANIKKEVRIKGRGVNLILCHTDLYTQFKAQVLAGGGVVVRDGPVAKMAAMGVENECLRIDNAYLTYDPGCPVNTVCCFDTTVWKFAVHPQFNFKVGKFIDNTTTGLNKDAYDYAYASTRFMFTCDNPWVNVRYSAIGT